MIIVSKCLAGCKCRYDGESNTDACAAALFEAGEAKCVCPECMGGMTTPRRPSEIACGDGFDVLDGKARVVNDAGEDVTEQFVSGAQAALKVALECGAKKAILKARSPSCGAGTIYDGSFSGTVKSGYGVTAALFERNGISVENR